MSFYTGLATMASRLLAEKGQQLTFSRNIGSTHNPALGSFSGGSVSTFKGYGASFDYVASEIDGTVIKRGDIRLLLEAITTPPVIGDSVAIDGASYRVMDVRRSSPGGTITHYNLQLRA